MEILKDIAKNIFFGLMALALVTGVVSFVMLVEAEPMKVIICEVIGLFIVIIGAVFARAAGFSLEI